MSDISNHLNELLLLSEAMQAAARKEDWGALEAIWPEFSERFAQLRDRLETRDRQALPETYRADLARLKDSTDSVIACAQPWLQASGSLIESWKKAEARYSPPPA